MNKFAFADSYLAKFRYYLRGYPDHLIDERVEEIRAHIEDATDVEYEELVNKHRHEPTCRRPRRADAERRVVERLKLPSVLASDIRRVLQRKGLSDGHEALLDSVTVAAGLALIAMSESTSSFWLLHMLLGSATLTIGLIGASIRMLPISHSAKIAKWLYATIRATRYGAMLTAGSQAALVSVTTIDASLQRTGANLSFHLHMTHVPVIVIMLIAATLLGIRPKMLAEYEKALKRCSDLSLYRKTQYRRVYDQLIVDDHERNYFTEPEW